MKIVVSGDYGEPKASKLLWPMQKKLNQCFERHIEGDYFNAISELSVVFRVSGMVTDFGSPGPDQLKFLKGGSEITIDFVISRESWFGVPEKTLKNFVARGMRECLTFMQSAAEKKDGTARRKKFNVDFESALSCFVNW